MAIDEFVVDPEEPAEERILFQTRLWMPQECPRISEGRLAVINKTRVNMVRSLRKAFGEQFSGGLIPTALAQQQYPDCCLPSGNAGRRNYFDLVKSCLICVTTAGLHESIGFKLPEYLAASRCIVTEPLKYRLPVPLEDGKHYLSFRTADECVTACERLLKDSQFANQMRRANHDYYLSEVEPAKLVYRCLHSAMTYRQ
jgi:hypothetical protein